MSDAPTPRTRIKRHPERASYDSESIHPILDEGLICHIAYVDAEGSPRIVPTIHTRIDDTLYLHGSAASRSALALRDGAEVAVAVTIVDGLVLARSAAKHSMNYRSVIVYGRAREVTDPDERLAVARAIVEHVVPGRADHVRVPDGAENKETLMLALAMTESSAKIRTGPPKDNERDLGAPTWAGVLPLHTVPGEPVPDTPGIPVPDHVTGYRRPSGR
jgi:nitroimidazol reductase NimA-like FMN-containing flavoprotein (pyridoxamine 5'-phosphate oxidase superfamily)